MTEQTEAPAAPIPDDMNCWADYWRYTIGVNVLPADSNTKRPIVTWSQWQNTPIPEEQHRQWKQGNLFSRGISIIPGKVWHSKEKNGLYLIFLDADRQQAITELCTSKNEKTVSLDEMAQKFLVEQHKDNLQKAHLYFYSPIPFPKKDADSVLGLEVKGLGEHGVASCAGSIHKNGQPWESIGTTNPITLTVDQAKEFIEHIDQVCKKYNLEYLQKHYQNLLDSHAKIYHGERHRSLISIANSLLFRYGDNDNGSDKLSPQLEQELKDKFLAINNERCEVPLPASEINQIWNDAFNYYSRRPKSWRNGNEIGKAAAHVDEEKEAELTYEQLSEYLASKIPDRDYPEYVIASINRTVKQEPSLVRQLFYIALSKDAASPQNLAVLAPTSEGKTHPVLEALKYFPERDIWTIGSMSPKVIIRQNGILVDKDNKPLDSQIAEIKKQVICLKHDLEQTNDNNKRSDIEGEIEDLNEQVVRLRNDAKVLIDLTGKLFVFLEPPHPETWNILKPILSHDKFEIEHPYVYQVEGKGFKVKKIVTRGWPACIFCSAKNESKWPEWPEVQSRFLITSPNMVTKKYLEGIKLSAQRKGLPKLAQQHVIISDDQVELAKKCVLYLQHQMKYYTNNQINQCPVWMPYYDIISDVLPSEKGTDNRVANRILDFINIVALAHGHQRQELQYGKERLVVADIKKDLPEVIRITQNITGLPTFKVDFFRKWIIGAYKDKLAKHMTAAVVTATAANHLNKTLDEETNAEDKPKGEEIIGVTSREIVDYYRLKTGKTTKSINTNNLKETYLDDYVMVGWLDYKEPEKPRQPYVYYPIIDLYEHVHEQEQEHGQQTKQSITLPLQSSQSIMTTLDYDLAQPRLLMHKNFKEIPKDWLEVEIQRLISYPVMLDTFELFNTSKEKTCICQFVEEYNANVDINGYFSKPELHKNYNKIFEPIKYIGEIEPEHGRCQSSHPIIDSLDCKNRFIYPHRTNINYQQQVIQIQTQKQTSNVLAGSTDKIIEESPSIEQLDHRYSCYYCADFKKNNKDEYERHIILRHNHCPAYPNKAEIEKRGLKAQGKSWEI